MRLQLSLLIVVASLQVGATDCGQVIRDPGFELWCGDQLCTWKLERGSVKRVGTWNAGDSGIELEGTDTAIEQLTPVTSDDGGCLRFDLIADVEDNAEVFLNVDVEGDGTSEMHERLPASHWKPLSFTFAVGGPYDAIRFELTKAGTGRAVVAQIQAETRPAEECAGLSQLDPGPRKNGARCVDGSSCESGLCRAGFFSRSECVGCDDTHACTSGEVCGLGEPFSPMLLVPTECVPEASAQIGAECLGGFECASHICTAGRCSECVVSGDCTHGETCNPAWEAGPHVCGGGQHIGLAGEACGTDDDCASSRCDGAARSECSDGRSCASPASCPVETGLVPGACTPVGIEGGSCE